MIIVAEPDANVRRSITRHLPGEVTDAASSEELQILLATMPIDAVLLGPGIAIDASLETSRWITDNRPEIGIALLAEGATTQTLQGAIRAGVREVIPRGEHERLAHTVEELVAHARRLRSAASARTTRRHGRLVTVFSAKGGSGRTTVATNVAVALAGGARDQVVLVDLDLQAGDVTAALALEPAGSIDRLLSEAPEPGIEDVQRHLTHHRDGLWVLAAPDGPLGAAGITVAHVRSILRVLREHFRYVIVDGPAAFTDPLLTALDRSDAVVLVGSMELTGIRTLHTTIDVLGRLGIGRDRIHLVLNRADSRVGLRVRDVERVLGTGIDVTIPSSADVPRSVNGGAAIVATSSGSPVGRALIGLAGRLRVDDSAGRGPAGVPSSGWNDPRVGSVLAVAPGGGSDGSRPGSAADADGPGSPTDADGPRSPWNDPRAGSPTDAAQPGSAGADQPADLPATTAQPFRAPPGMVGAWASPDAAETIPHQWRAGPTAAPSSATGSSPSWHEAAAVWHSPGPRPPSYPPPSGSRRRTS